MKSKKSGILPSTYPTKARLGNRRKSRRYILLLLIFLTVYSIYCHLPNSRGNKSSNDDDDDNDGEATAHFLYPSSFRDHPDVEYEARIDAALRELESRTRSVNDRVQANNTIWQIMLGKNGGRNTHSIAFEDDNPEWTYSLVTSNQAKAFVTETFNSIPDLVTVYKSYPYDVLRADLLRYLLLWYHGGFYADLDVRPKRSIETCPALQPLFTPTTTSYNNNNNNNNKITKPTHNISLVVGIEIDEPYASPRFMREWRWSRTYGFVQWTTYAPQRFSPILRKVIVRVLAHTKQYDQQHSLKKSGLIPWNPIRTLTKWRWSRIQNKVLSITGPRVFTDAVLDVLSETLPRGHALVETSVDTDQGVGELVVSTSLPVLGEEEEEGKKKKKKNTKSYNVTVPRVTWAPFHRLKEPLWIEASEGDGMGGLGVLPVNVWGNGQRHSGSESFFSAHACVNHLFQGTWKKWWWQKLFN